MNLNAFPLEALWGIAGVFVYEALRYYRIYVQSERNAQKITFYHLHYGIIFLALCVAAVLANIALSVELTLQGFINGYALPSGLGALLKTNTNGTIVEDFRETKVRPPLSALAALKQYWY